MYFLTETDRAQLMTWLSFADECYHENDSCEIKKIVKQGLAVGFFLKDDINTLAQLLVRIKESDHNDDYIIEKEEPIYDDWKITIAQQQSLQKKRIHQLEQLFKNWLFCISANSLKRNIDCKNNSIHLMKECHQGITR